MRLRHVPRAARRRRLAAEETQNALFDKKLAEEEVWIRTGIKARRTRNEGRVRALERLRRIRSDRREAAGKVQLAIQEGERSGMLVAEVEGVSFAYGERAIVRDFSTSIMRGDKIGIIGPNGAGKTTLLRILLGQLPPQAGTVRLGTNLQIAYFDQLRQQLNDEASVQDNVADGYDTVRIGGGSRHVIGYLQDFLFSPERARTAGQVSLRRRTQSAAAGQAVRQAGQRDRARRADQRSGHRNAGTARRAAGGVRRDGAARQPRPDVS